MAAVLESVPETLYESLWDAVETVDNTGTTPPPRAAAVVPPATMPAINWLFVARIFIVCVLLLVAVRQLRRRRHRKAL